MPEERRRRVLVDLYERHRVFVLSCMITVIAGLGIVLLVRPTEYERAEKACAAEVDEQLRHFLQMQLPRTDSMNEQEYEASWNAQFDRCVRARVPSDREEPQ